MVSCEIKQTVKKAIDRFKLNQQNRNPIDNITYGKENCEGQALLSRVLATKATQMDLDRLNEIKANREDSEDLQDIVVTMN